jgi:hypothetical protein
MSSDSEYDSEVEREEEHRDSDFSDSLEYAGSELESLINILQGSSKLGKRSTKTLKLIYKDVKTIVKLIKAKLEPEAN